MSSKVQRNTQAELIAVLTTVLTWRDELAGGCLLVLGDSTSSETNMRKQTAGNQHSRDIVAQLHMLCSVYRIHLWFDWVPSKQNPGDPYSRPLTDSELANELDKQCAAQRVEPELPLSLWMRPHAWRGILSQTEEPTTWPNALKFDLLTRLGLIQPSGLAEMLLQTVDPDKAPCLLLGYWARSFSKGKGKATGKGTAWFKHVVQAMQHVTNAVAPLEGIFSIAIEQNIVEDKVMKCTLSVPIKHKVCSIRIAHGKVQISRRTGDKWTIMMNGTCQTGNRSVLVIAGRSAPDLPVQERAKMHTLGFSLKHVP
jgi:hypothetical protein